jgi:Zn-dependent protease with chaperone function
MASHIYLVSVVGALLLPAAWTLIFRLLALRSEEMTQTANWFAYRRRMRAFTILAIPAWWSLSSALSEPGGKLDPIPNWPAWILFLVPLSIGIAVGQFIAHWSDSRILSRRWTAADLFRLSFWSTLSSAVPLIMFAVGIDAVRARSVVGVLWITCAAILSLIGTVRLRTAEGLKLRAVKSGELYKRSFGLAKRMGVRLKRVSVVPFGRGRLTNAFGGWRGIAMTDDYGHWLHGAQLDFVIGHELAHVQQKHVFKKLWLIAASLPAMAALTFAVPHLTLVWRILFNFSVILLPLFAFYFVSRRFEFAADRIAVESTRDGEAGIGALASLYRRSGVPTKSNSFEELFSTHPDLWQRMDAIAGVSRVSAECLNKVQQQFSDHVNDESALLASQHEG